MLTIRLSDDEDRVLGRRARAADLKRATLVRMLIREKSFVSGVDVLVDAARRSENPRLRVRASHEP